MEMSYIITNQSHDLLDSIDMRKYDNHYCKVTTIRDPANFPITVTLRKCYTTVHNNKHVVVCWRLMAVSYGMHDVAVYFMAARTSLIQLR